jgi:hypothetical protein
MFRSGMMNNVCLLDFWANVGIVSQIGLFVSLFCASWISKYYDESVVIPTRWDRFLWNAGKVLDAISLLAFHTMFISLAGFMYESVPPKWHVFGICNAILYGCFLVCVDVNIIALLRKE